MLITALRFSAASFSSILTSGLSFRLLQSRCEDDTLPLSNFPTLRLTAEKVHVPADHMTWLSNQAHGSYWLINGEFGVRSEAKAGMKLIVCGIWLREAELDAKK